MAERVIPALGFDGGFFNMELFVPEGDPARPARLIEVNGRLASQFAPLVRAVQGRSTYEALFRLACGEDPRWRRTPARCVAISYCLRVFEDAFVVQVPAPVRLETESEELTVLGDADHLTRLFVNLLENALRHTPPDGAVTLSARQATDGVRCVWE